MTVGGERADEWTIQWTDGQNGVKWTRVPAPRPAAAGEGTAVMKHRRATGASLLPKTLPAVGSPPNQGRPRVNHSLVGLVYAINFEAAAVVVDLRRGTLYARDTHTRRAQLYATRCAAVKTM